MAWKSICQKQEDEVPALRNARAEDPRKEPLLWYIPAFYWAGLFLVNQLVQTLTRYGLDGVIAPSLLLGQSGPIRLIWTPQVFKGYQLYSNLFLQREMVAHFYLYGLLSV